MAGAVRIELTTYGFGVGTFHLFQFKIIVFMRVRVNGIFKNCPKLQTNAAKLQTKLQTNFCLIGVFFVCFFYQHTIFSLIIFLWRVDNPLLLIIYYFAFSCQLGDKSPTKKHHSPNAPKIP